MHWIYDFLWYSMGFDVCILQPWLHLVEPEHISDNRTDEDNRANEDNFLALERPSPCLECQAEPPTANISAIIGNHHDNLSDAAGNNNDQKLQSQ
jgi:hypothetical protein